MSLIHAPLNIQRVGYHFTKDKEIIHMQIKTILQTFLNNNINSFKFFNQNCEIRAMGRQHIQTKISDCQSSTIALFLQQLQFGPELENCKNKLQNYLCSFDFVNTVKSRVLTRLVQKHMQAFSDCLLMKGILGPYVL